MIASSYNEYMLMDALNLSANELLKLKLFSDLFKGSDDENKKLYRHLLKKWHPDMNTTDTSNVFVHITQLYDSLSIAVSPKSVEINGKEYPYMRFLLHYLKHLEHIQYHGTKLQRTHLKDDYTYPEL